MPRIGGGYFGGVKLRLVSAIAALAVVAGLISACVPEPAPSPSPTGFATEEEAFAAAEATYRAYVDALNQVDLSDPETFEAVYAWTTGEANAGARRSFSRMSADGWVVAGLSTVDSFTHIAAEIGDGDRVSLAACLNVSAVTLEDASGVSVVANDRPDVQVVRVDTVASPASSTGMVIEKFDGYEEPVCG